VGLIPFAEDDSFGNHFPETNLNRNFSSATTTNTHEGKFSNLFSLSSSP